MRRLVVLGFILTACVMAAAWTNLKAQKPGLAVAPHRALEPSRRLPVMCT